MSETNKERIETMELKQGTGSKAVSEIFGFKVIKLDGEHEAAYELRGKRGARRFLVRHLSNKRLMYVTDQFMNIIAIKGNYTFADDEPGELRPVYKANLYL